MTTVSKFNVDPSSIYQSGKVTSERARQISKCDQAAKRLLTSSVRDLVPKSALAASNAQEPNSAYKLREEPYEEIHVTILKGTMSARDRAELTILALTHLYRVEESLETIEYTHYLGLFLQILGTYVTEDAYTTGTMTKTLEARGYKLVLHHVDTSEALHEHYIMGDPSGIEAEIGVTSAALGEKKIQALGCSVMLLMAKRLLQTSLVQWFTNRMRTFSGILGVDVDGENITPPNLENCNRLNRYISQYSEVRGEIFKIIVSVANRVGKWQNLFTRFVGLLRWTEMSHIALIYEHILLRNPEIFSFGHVSGQEVHQFEHALKFLESYDQDQRPFLKLMLDHSKTELLHSGKFKMLTAAARVIASRTQPSMSNLNLGGNLKLTEFTNSVSLYLDHKERISIRSVARAGHVMAEEEDVNLILLAITNGPEDEMQVEVPGRI